MKPRHTHDCDTCEFLGRLDYFDPWSETWQETDLYFCAKADRYAGGTLIARRSSEGSDYSSVPRTFAERWAETFPWSTAGPAIVAASNLLKNREAIKNERTRQHDEETAKDI